MSSYNRVALAFFLLGLWPGRSLRRGRGRCRVDVPRAPHDGLDKVNKQTNNKYCCFSVPQQCRSSRRININIDVAWARATATSPTVRCWSPPTSNRTPAGPHRACCRAVVGHPFLRVRGPSPHPSYLRFPRSLTPGAAIRRSVHTAAHTAGKGCGPACADPSHSHSPSRLAWSGASTDPPRACL